MPPEKYIVNVIKKFKKRRAQKRVRESGYAASVVATMLNSVPAAVYRMVFPYLSHRSGWFKTCS